MIDHRLSALIVNEKREMFNFKGHYFFDNV